MDEQRQDDQLETKYSSSVPIWEVVLKTCREQWTIEKGGEKGLGISVLMVRHDDDNDDEDDIKTALVVERFSSSTGLLASHEIHGRVNLLSFLLRCSTRPHEWGAQ